MLSQQLALSRLQKYWQIEDFQFLGVLDRPKNENGSLKNFGFFKLKLNDRPLKYPLIDGYRYQNIVNVFIPDARTLDNGKTYLIKAKIAEDTDRIKQNNPFLLAIDELFEIEQSLNHTNVNTSKSIINRLFGERGGLDPVSAETIAGQLTLNQLELYTETERFVFELIQNADDMPVGRNGVEINISLLPEFFIFQHNGQAFNESNVSAICNAAQSTKRRDETKTGYKGIGFKSVFSDSERVFIKSDDFSFKFDKHASIYKDFKELYKPHWSSLAEPNKITFFENWRGREDDAIKIEKIAWQIKPIWIDGQDYPEEIKEFLTNNFNVNIALNINASTIRDKNYLELIGKLINDPRFLLFLRHTKKISYSDWQANKCLIEVEKNHHLTTVYSNKNKLSDYQSFTSDIEINDDSFKKAGYDLLKKEVNGKVVFKNKEEKILENIPEKLGHLNQSTISFAVEFVNGKISPEKVNQSILYNYLPTSDTRFGFPFIVNADFICKTDREFILADNIWNHYLFYQIGYSVVLWLVDLTKQNLTSSYLKILPPELLDEDITGRSEINSSFNRGLKDGLNEIAVILDTTNSLRLASEIIFDRTGLSIVISDQAYIDFINSNKYLTNIEIEYIDLKIPYLEIEVIGNKKIKPFFALPDSIKILNNKIESFNDEEYQKFLNWLNSSELSYEELSKLKFIAFGNEFYSLEEVYEDENKLFLFDERLKGIGEIIKSYGGKTSSIDLSLFTELYETITEDEASYYEQKNGLYLKIVSFFDAKVSSLNTEDKYSILEVLRSIDGIDIKTISKLPWYKNALGVLKSLPDLYNNDGIVYSSKYNDFFLHRTEIKCIPKLYFNEVNLLGDLLEDEVFSLAYYQGTNYDEEHEDVKLLEIFLKLAETDSNIYQSLAQKITWNGNSIDGELYLDEVSISFKDSEEKEIEENFKLVELVSDLTTSNKHLDELLSSLKGLSVVSREILRSRVFKLKEFKTADIKKAIQSKSDTSISYPQFLYLAIDAWLKNHTTLKLESASLVLSDQFIFSLLDYLFTKKAIISKTEYVQNGSTYLFLPKNKFVIIDKELLLDDEVVPAVYTNWIANDILKQQFFVEEGCFDCTHPHYKFRKALSLNNVSECLQLLGELEKDKSLFINTATFVQKFGEQIYNDTNHIELVVKFYSLVSSLNNDNLSSLDYPFLSPKNKNLYFKALDDINTCYAYTIDEWRGYEEEIVNYIEIKEFDFIHQELLLPTKYKNKVLKEHISPEINLDILNEHSELFSALYYENWSQKSQFPIYIYSGSYIPHKLSFGDLILDQNFDVGKPIHQDGNSFYVVKELEEEMPFCIHDMDTPAWRSLTEAKFYYRPNNPGGPTPEKSELTEEEIENYKRLFGRDYSKTDREAAWLLVAFKSLSYYEAEGYKIAGYMETLHKKFFEFTKDGQKITVYPRSAKGDLLYITIQAWEDLDNDATELFVLLKKNKHRIIKSKEELLIDGDKLLFSMNMSDSNKKISVVDNLFNKDSIHELKYDVNSETTLIVRMNNTPEFKFLFEGFGNERNNINDFG